MTMKATIPVSIYKLSKRQEAITYDVTNCAACGRKHKNWRFDLLPKKLRFRKGGKTFTHVARCLNEDRLVYLAVKS